MSEFTDFLLSIVVNAIPLLVMFLLYFLIQRQAAKKIYLRFYLSILLFYLIYYILPALFQRNALDLVAIDGTSGTVSQGIEFLIVRAISMILSWFHYPIIILPFVFTVAPFLSMFILIRNLKEEEGTLQDKLKALNYEYNKSPTKYIEENIKSQGWQKEKELFKTMVVLLPITLYLLTVVLDLAGLKATSIENSETAIGWFLEILFVYVATFLLGFQLLVSAKISIGGKYLGEKVRNNLFKSLNEVGTPIAIISIFLFVAQNRENPEGLGLVFYFFAYFIMATFTFVVLMKVFEPFSILLLVKFLTWYIQNKTANQGVQNIANNEKPQQKQQINSHFIVIGLGILSIFVVLLFSSMVTTAMNFISLKWTENINELINLTLVGTRPSINLVLDTELLNVISSFGIQLVNLMYAFFFSLAIPKSKSVFKAMMFYGGTLILITIILSPLFIFKFPIDWTFGDAWITGSPIILQMFGFSFYSARTAFLTATFENNLFLTVITYPYTIIKPIANFGFWGVIFYFGRKEFRTRSIQIDSTTMEKITFAPMDGCPEKYEIIESHSQLKFLVTKNAKKQVDNIPDLLKTIVQSVETEKSFGELLSIVPDRNPELLYEALRKLCVNKFIVFWTPEFSYYYRKSKLDALYIMAGDGRDLFTYQFSEGIKPEPGLISGMFSAITAFIKETTKSRDLLRYIDNGDKKILLEYGNYIIIALFADSSSAELREKLVKLILKFEAKFEKILKRWNGDCSPFMQEDSLVKEIFEIE